MRFWTAVFRRVCVKNTRNASAFLRFLPCHDKQLLIQNCLAPKIRKFPCNRVFLWWRHTAVCRDKKRTSVREITDFGRIVFDSPHLTASRLKVSMRSSTIFVKINDVALAAVTSIYSSSYFLSFILIPFGQIMQGLSSENKSPCSCYTLSLT